MILVNFIRAIALIVVICNKGRAILDGYAAVIEDAPWIASLSYDGVNSSCGGVVITKDVVLTAAHCISNRTSCQDSCNVRIGSPGTRTGGQVVSVKDVIIHDKYERGFSNHDVALLELQEPLRFQLPSVRAIRLPPFDHQILTGTLVSVTGWGVTIENVSEILQTIYLNIINVEQCKESNYGTSVSLVDKICALSPNGDRFPVEEDSGLPLVQNGTLLGVCGSLSSSGVYTNVIPMLEWIDNTIKGIERRNLEVPHGNFPLVLTVLLVSVLIILMVGVVIIFFQKPEVSPDAGDLSDGEMMEVPLDVNLDANEPTVSSKIRLEDKRTNDDEH